MGHAEGVQREGPVLKFFHEGVVAFDRSHEFKADLGFLMVNTPKLCINGIGDKDRTCYNSSCSKMRVARDTIGKKRDKHFSKDSILGFTQ